MKGRLLKILEDELTIYELLCDGKFITFYEEDELNRYIIKHNIEIISIEEV